LEKTRIAPVGIRPLDGHLLNKIEAFDGLKDLVERETGKQLMREIVPFEKVLNVIKNGGIERHGRISERSRISEPNETARAWVSGERKQGQVAQRSRPRTEFFNQSVISYKV
jgi:hypothetical protein